jgi:hypothetical protein
MRYREAKHLKQGDEVFAKESGTLYYVKNIEVYGQVKMVRINCVNETGDGDVSWFHTEVK